MNHVRRIAKEIQLEHSRSAGAVFFHGPLMLPFLEDGDLLTVVPVSFEEVRSGDIITFRDAEKFPTSRVIRKDGDRLLVKGDNFIVTREVSSEEVLGRVVERRRGEARLNYGSLAWKAATALVLLRLRVHGIVSRLRK